MNPVDGDSRCDHNSAVMNLTKEAAKTFFANHHPKMTESWTKAWDLHTKQINHPFLLPSCRAHIIQNLAFGFAHTNLCVPESNIYKMEVHNQQLIRFGSEVIVGFKKLNDEGFSAHAYPTTRSKQYYRQEELPGIGSMPRLVCGIKLTDDWTSVVGVYLMHPKNHREHNWVLNLSEGCTEIDLDQQKIEFEDDEQFFTAPATIRKPKSRIGD